MSFFRKRYPDQKSFTFNRGISKSRIGYFLKRSSCDCNIEHANVSHFPFSDHDLVFIDTDFSKTEKGPGVWKLNASTIYSTQFHDSIEQLWPT